MLGKADMYNLAANQPTTRMKWQEKEKIRINLALINLY